MGVSLATVYQFGSWSITLAVVHDCIDPSCPATPAASVLPPNFRVVVTSEPTLGPL
jgi:hypothetical protein